jgi:protein-S-isoprenylcysteine O-methyltransferase Ste14
MNNRSSVVVFFQMVFMLLFLVTGPLYIRGVLHLAIVLSSAALGAWAILHMRKESSFGISPEPKKEAHLLDTGPYAYIRNPMYSAVILGFAVFLADNFSPVRLVIYVLLVAVLLFKILREEQFLTKKFTGYAAYKSRTKRLIPFIY